MSDSETTGISMRLHGPASVSIFSSLCLGEQASLVPPGTRFLEGYLPLTRSQPPLPGCSQGQVLQETAPFTKQEAGTPAWGHTGSWWER